MNTLVVYDSFFGNTEKVAQAMAQALGAPGEVTLVRASEATPEQLAGAPLVLVGSPTRGGRASPATVALLGRIPAHGLQGVKVAAFDTRTSPDDIDSAFVRWLARLFGYAANRIAPQLVNKGGVLAVPVEGFIVKGTKGPLREGELERAAAWARLVAGKA